MLVAELQNITLSLPRALLKRVKRVAVDRGSSVSALVAEALTRVADDHRRYPSARRQSLAALRSAGSLGTKGQRAWTRDGRKREVAAQLLERLWESESGRLSVQVLQEFFVTITRKVAHPLPVVEAEDRVRELTAWPVFAPTAEDVLQAIAVARKMEVSFWDAMILHAAAESGCDMC